MPRKTRIDAPEALRHIFVRGIEMKKIFKDDTACVKFFERLGVVSSIPKQTALPVEFMSVFAHGLSCSLIGSPSQEAI